MRPKYLILSVILVFSSSLLGQGTFLDKGNSGFGIGSVYGTREHISNFGGNLGYSFNGMVDLGFALYREVTENRVLGDDLNSLSISPSLSFVQHYNQIMMSVTLAYRHDFINSNAFDSLEIDASADYYSVGGSIFDRIWMTESFFIQPFANGYYIAGREKARNPSEANTQPSLDEFRYSHSSIKTGPIYQEIPPGQTRSEFIQKIIWGFGLDFCLEATPDIILHLAPNIQVDDGEMIVGVRGGFVFQTARKAVRSDKSSSMQKQDRFVRLAIANILKKHFLLYLTDQTPMKEGDSFDIIRRNDLSSEWTRIGTAKAVRVQEAKVVFEYYLDSKYDQLNTDDRIVYRY